MSTKGHIPVQPTISSSILRVFKTSQLDIEESTLVPS